MSDLPKHYSRMPFGCTTREIVSGGEPLDHGMRLADLAAAFKAAREEDEREAWDAANDGERFDGQS